MFVLAQLLSARATGAGGLGFDSRTGQIGTVSPMARHRCDASSELVARALSREDGLCHSLHA